MIKKLAYELQWVNSGSNKPSVDLKKPGDIVQDLINARNNPIGLDLTFRKKIKVI